jgi:hypothetical protein
MRYTRTALILLGTIVVAAIPFTFLTDPNATLADFSVATESVVKKQIVRHVEGSSDCFDLEVSTKSGRIYRLRQPDSVLLTQYLEALPGEGMIVVHYRETLKGLQLLDARDGEHTYIDLATYLGDVKHKRILILLAAAGMSAIGVFAFLHERGSAVRTK